jgi:hypothetical protein
MCEGVATYVLCTLPKQKANYIYDIRIATSSPSIYVLNFLHNYTHCQKPYIYI